MELTINSRHLTSRQNSSSTVSQCNAADTKARFSVVHSDSLSFDANECGALCTPVGDECDECSLFCFALVDLVATTVILEENSELIFELESFQNSLFREGFKTDARTTRNRLLKGVTEEPTRTCFQQGLKTSTHSNNPIGLASHPPPSTHGQILHSSSSPSLSSLKPSSPSFQCRILALSSSSPSSRSLSPQKPQPNAIRAQDNDLFSFIASKSEFSNDAILNDVTPSLDKAIEIFGISPSIPDIEQPSSSISESHVNSNNNGTNSASRSLKKSSKKKLQSSLGIVPPFLFPPSHLSPCPVFIPHILLSVYHNSTSEFEAMTASPVGTRKPSFQNNAGGGRVELTTANHDDNKSHRIYSSSSALNSPSQFDDPSPSASLPIEPNQGCFPFDLMPNLIVPVLVDDGCDVVFGPDSSSLSGGGVAAKGRKKEVDGRDASSSKGSGAGKSPNRRFSRRGSKGEKGGIDDDAHTPNATNPCYVLTRDENPKENLKKMSSSVHGSSDSPFFQPGESLAFPVPLFKPNQVISANVDLLPSLPFTPPVPPLSPLSLAPSSSTPTEISSTPPPSHRAPRLSEGMRESFSSNPSLEMMGGLSLAMPISSLTQNSDTAMVGSKVPNPKRGKGRKASGEGEGRKGNPLTPVSSPHFLPALGGGGNKGGQHMEVRELHGEKPSTDKSDFYGGCNINDVGLRVQANRSIKGSDAMTTEEAAKKDSHEDTHELECRSTTDDSVSINNQVANEGIDNTPTCFLDDKRVAGKARKDGACEMNSEKQSTEYFEKGTETQSSHRFFHQSIVQDTESPSNEIVHQYQDAWISNNQQVLIPNDDSRFSKRNASSSKIFHKQKIDISQNKDVDAGGSLGLFSSQAHSHTLITAGGNGIPSTLNGSYNWDYKPNNNQQNMSLNDEFPGLVVGQASSTVNSRSNHHIGFRNFSKIRTGLANCGSKIDPQISPYLHSSPSSDLDLDTSTMLSAAAFFNTKHSDPSLAASSSPIIPFSSSPLSTLFPTPISGALSSTSVRNEKLRFTSVSKSSSSMVGTLSLSSPETTPLLSSMVKCHDQNIPFMNPYSTDHSSMCGLPSINDNLITSSSGNKWFDASFSPLISTLTSSPPLIKCDPASSPSAPDPHSLPSTEASHNANPGDILFSSKAIAHVHILSPNRSELLSRALGCGAFFYFTTRVTEDDGKGRGRNGGMGGKKHEEGRRKGEERDSRSDLNTNEAAENQHHLRRLRSGPMERRRGQEEKIKGHGGPRLCKTDCPSYGSSTHLNSYYTGNISNGISRLSSGNNYSLLQNKANKGDEKTSTVASAIPLHALTANQMTPDIRARLKYLSLLQLTTIRAEAAVSLLGNSL